MWRWVLAAVALAVALGCFGLGYRVGAAARASDRRAEEIRTMPIVTGAAQLDDAPAGRRVLVVGRVAPGNPGTDYPDRAGATRRFVAYTVTRVDVDPPDRNGVVRSYSVKERVEAPPFALALPDGTVRMVNAGYYLGSPRSYGTTPEGRGVDGFAEGDTVAVDGTVVRGADGVALRTSAVTGTSPEAYITSGSSRRGRELEIFVGQAVACVGVPFLLAAVLLAAAAWHARRRGGQPPGGDSTSTSEVPTP